MNRESDSKISFFFCQTQLCSTLKVLFYYCNLEISFCHSKSLIRREPLPVFKFRLNLCFCQKPQLSIVPGTFQTASSSDTWYPRSSQKQIQVCFSFFIRFLFSFFVAYCKWLKSGHLWVPRFKKISVGHGLRGYSDRKKNMERICEKKDFLLTVRWKSIF